MGQIHHKIIHKLSIYWLYILEIETTSISFPHISAISFPNKSAMGEMKV